MDWMLAQSAVPPGFEDWLDRGVLGILVVAILVGWLAPKWVLDEYRKREAVKDDVIERLTKAIEAIAARTPPHE